MAVAATGAHLLGAVHLLVLVPATSLEFDRQVLVAMRTSRPLVGSTRAMPPVRRWSDRQHRADRLDPIRRAVGIDERDHYFRRSTSAARKTPTLSADLIVTLQFEVFASSCLVSRVHPSSDQVAGRGHVRLAAPSGPTLRPRSLTLATDQMLAHCGDVRGRDPKPFGLHVHAASKRTCLVETSALSSCRWPDGNSLGRS